MPEVVAETPRMILRHERPNDLDALLDAMNTPAMMRHLGGVQTRVQIEEKLARNAVSRAEHGYCFWILEHRETGCIVGNCGISRIAAAAAPAQLQGEPQIGWKIVERCWRQGYATEAARAALALAFGRFDLPLIHAQTSDANVASWTLMERLGMARAAELDYIDPDFPPHENPTIIYSLSRGDWQNR